MLMAGRPMAEVGREAGDIESRVRGRPRVGGLYCSLLKLAKKHGLADLSGLSIQ